MMSVPRDLKVDIPGHGRQDQRRLRARRRRGSTVRTVKKLFTDRRAVKINHVINVDFGGFRQVVDYVGCVYVDIDRDYFNDNSGGRATTPRSTSTPATSSYGPGRARLRALPPGDNDLVRAARQQDFLRQVQERGRRPPAPQSTSAGSSTAVRPLQTGDKALRSNKDIFSLLKLVLSPGAEAGVREVRFRVDITDDPEVYLTASQEQANSTRPLPRVPQRPRPPRSRARPRQGLRRPTASPRRRARSATPGSADVARASRSPGARARTTWRVRAPGEPVSIRRDARWSVPEPELALVVNRRGTIVGYTIGNDMSSRDIEGENPLYLPQAKVYDGSCALGPARTRPRGAARARHGDRDDDRRDGATVFDGGTTLAQMRRTPEELVEFLYRETSFPHGAILLTGTGVVPPDDFTLRAGDAIAITIPPIGTLENVVGAR